MFDTLLQIYGKLDWKDEKFINEKNSRNEKCLVHWFEKSMKNSLTEKEKSGKFDK